MHYASAGEKGGVLALGSSNIFRGFQLPDSRSEQVVNESFTLERKLVSAPA